MVVQDLQTIPFCSLENQTTPTAALDVLHHQRYGGSGLVYETIPFCWTVLTGQVNVRVAKNDRTFLA